MPDDPPHPPRKPRRPNPGTPKNPAPSGGGGEGGGSKRRKVRTKQCFHCLTPHTVLHRVRVAEDGPWESVCDVCWDHRCVGNPHYDYGGLWDSGRLTQPGEQKATAQKKRKRRSPPGPGGGGGGKPRRDGPPRPRG